MPLLAAIITIVTILVAAVVDPKGFINQLICGLIDLIAIPFPSTPDSLKLSSIINTLSLALPVFGKALIQSIIGTFADLFFLYATIKIYKLIPFKAS